MSAPASIPIFGDAYLADTQHLTLEEHGAYFKLMIIAWRSPNCALPDDDKRIATMLGITGKKWSTIKTAVMAFWSLGDFGWQQKRLLKEYRWASEKSAKASAAATGRHANSFPAGVKSSHHNSNLSRANENINSLKTNDTCDANAGANVGANGYAPPPPPTEEEKNPPAVVKKTDTTAAKRGSRLPTDFVMPADWLDWAVADRNWRELDATEESAAFIDYWHARAGSGGVKLDWQATWRNWCRNSKRMGNARPNASPGLQFGNGPRQPTERLTAGLRILSDFLPTEPSYR